MINHLPKNGNLVSLSLSYSPTIISNAIINAIPTTVQNLSLKRCIIKDDVDQNKLFKKFKYGCDLTEVKTAGVFQTAPKISFYF